MPPTAGNQRFLFIYCFSTGFSFSGVLCVGCTYRPWLMSLTFREMWDCLRSFGTEGLSSNFFHGRGLALVFMVLQWRCP